jgi:hypothetical protein
MVQAHVDRATCYAAGIDIVVDKDHTHVEDFFYDNVGMKGDANWRRLGGGGDEFEYEIQDPHTMRFRTLHENLTDHRFPVGVSIVEVIGYDYAGNQHSCIRTVVVCDTPDEYCGNLMATPMALAVNRPEHIAPHISPMASYIRAMSLHHPDLNQLVHDARTHGHHSESPLMMQHASRSPKSLLSFRKAHKTKWVDGT